MNKPATSIVVATDFSAHARHAADRAARIAHEQGAALTLLHVLPGPLMAQVRAWLGADGAPAAQLVDDAQRRLQASVERLPLKPAAVDARVEEGSLRGATLAAAERLDARLIVLGARGEGFMRRAVLGSSAQRLTRGSARPLLVVRQIPHAPYRRVLVAVDLSPASAATLALARWVAPRAQLVLANVFEVPLEGRLRLAGVDAATIQQYREHARAEARRGLLALAAQAGLPDDCWQPCVVEGDASFRLIELEQEQDCDLVALGKHGVSAATDMLLGSVTQHVLAEGTVDVLISTGNPA